MEVRDIDFFRTGLRRQAGVVLPVAEPGMVRPGQSCRPDRCAYAVDAGVNSDACGVC